MTLETNEKTARIGLSITPIMSSIHKSKENNENKVDMKKKGNRQASAAGGLAGGSVDRGSYVLPGCYPRNLNAEANPVSFLPTSAPSPLHPRRHIPLASSPPMSNPSVPQRITNHSMKRPRSPSSDRRARPRQPLARMSCGGTPPTKQSGLEWEFDHRKGTICHEGIHDGNCNEEKECKICMRFKDHVHPKNGKPDSFQRATLDRDRWFRDYLESLSDASSDYDLDSQASQDSDLERVQTDLSAKCSEVERLRIQLGEAQNDLELARQAKVTLVTENLRLKIDYRKSNEERRRLHREFSYLEGQHEVLTQRLSQVEEREDDLRQELVATKEQLGGTRRELENAHQELEQMRPPAPSPIQGAPTSSTPASSCGQSQDQNRRVYIVISP